MAKWLPMADSCTWEDMDVVFWAYLWDMLLNGNFKPLNSRTFEYIYIYREVNNGGKSDNIEKKIDNKLIQAEGEIY